MVNFVSQLDWVIGYSEMCMYVCVRVCLHACARAQSCPTLRDPMDCSPPAISVHGVLQARILEWVAIPFSRESSYPGVGGGSPTLQADSLPSESPGKPTQIYGQTVFWVFL